MARNTEHLEALLQLPAAERSAAAEALLESLEEEAADREVHDAWVRELERRIAEDAAGIPADQVFAEGRERLTKLS